MLCVTCCNGHWHFSRCYKARSRQTSRLTSPQTVIGITYQSHPRTGLIPAVHAMVGPAPGITTSLISRPQDSWDRGLLRQIHPKAFKAWMYFTRTVVHVLKTCLCLAVRRWASSIHVGPSSQQFTCGHRESRDPCLIGGACRQAAETPLDTPRRASRVKPYVWVAWTLFWRRVAYSGENRKTSCTRSTSTSSVNENDLPTDSGGNEGTWCFVLSRHMCSKGHVVLYLFFLINWWVHVLQIHLRFVPVKGVERCQQNLD